MAAVNLRDTSAAPTDAWVALASATNAQELCDAWLAVLVGSLLHARAGLVLLAQGDGAFAPVAAVPAARDLSYLSDIATESLRAREGVVRSDELGHARIAYPLHTGTVLAGVVVVDLGAVDAPGREQALRLVHWGAGWLVDLLQRRHSEQALVTTKRGRFVLDTLLALQLERSEREAGLALVNRLAREFGCSQVLLGVARRKTLEVLAMSHTAVFDKRAATMDLARQAMHEAFDQRQRVDWPAEAADALTRVGVAHRRYAEAAGARHLCSVPLSGVDRVVGVLMLECDRAFDAGEHEWLETLACALAPLLELQREAAMGASARALRTAGRWLGRATDGSHPAIKLGVGAAVAALVALAIWPVTFRVSAPAVVEGAVQRSVVAPFEGFLREAPAKAGDRVHAGQVLAVLDDKDLRLERVRWESELEVALRKEREAMARGNRVDQRLAAAQANQARAQLDLVLARLDRVVITAPLDGVVVTGDLTQQLGSPIEQGKLLFEVAPLDGWRVILEVDERDIAHVAKGAGGELVLASLPGQRWPFTVRAVTPVSVAEEGRNTFRVEAELGDQAPKLSPNMEGVGKIEVGQASLLWIWTRRLVDWLRLTWWAWMP